jgi:hypothetical protein
MRSGDIRLAPMIRAVQKVYGTIKRPENSIHLHERQAKFFMSLKKLRQISKLSNVNVSGITNSLNLELRTKLTMSQSPV